MTTRITYDYTLPSTTKAIWGAGPLGFQDFMGISSGSGDAITDSPASYTAAYTAEPYVYKCATVRMDALASAPLRCWQRKADGQRGDAVDHPSLALLRFTCPKEGYVRGTEELMGYSLGSLDFHGRSAWQLAFNSKGPSEIYWLAPARFAPVPDESGAGLLGLKVDGKTFVPSSNVVYLRTKNFSDPLQGTSKIAVLKDTINLRRASVQSNISFFKNSARPDLIISGQWQNTPENIDRLRRSWNRAFTGENNRSPFFAGEGTDAKLLTIAPKDLEWLGQQRLSGEEISAAFKVPLVYLNNWEHSITNANFDVARTELWHNGIMPDADAIAAQLTRSFLWRFWPETMGKFELGFDYTKVDGLQEDVERLTNRVNAVWTGIRTDVDKKVLTPNQARPLMMALADQLGLPSDGYKGQVPGGDTFYFPFQELPLDQHLSQAIINFNAARGTNPDLIEDVPGAPNASRNAAAAATRLGAAQQAAQQAATARLQSQQAGNQPTPPPAGQQPPPTPPPTPPPAKALDAAEIDNIIRLALDDKLTAKRQPSSGPHPMTVRDARLAKPIDQLTRRLKKHFQSLQSESLRTLRGKGGAQGEVKAALPDPGDPLYDVDVSRGKLQMLIQSGYSIAGAQAYLAAAEDYGLGVQWADANPWLPTFMGQRLGLINGIDDTTSAALAGELQAGADAGETIDQVAARVSSVFKTAIGSRSTAIARTELMSAYGSASIAAYRDAQVELAEMYDGSDFDDECAAMDGQILSLDEADAAMGDEHVNGTRAVAPYFGKPSEAAGASKPANVKELGPGIRLIA